MNRKHLSAGLPAVVAASALVLLLMSCNNQSTGTEKKQDSLSSMPRLCKSIAATDLQNRLKSSGSGRTMASIYPIKKSGDMSKKDFDLVIILHEGSNASAVPPADVKKFEKETAYYVQYMKKHRPGLKDIPNLYYVTVRRKDAKTLHGLQVCIDLTTTAASYVFTGPTGASSWSLDSAGKCPPECPMPEPPQ